MQPFTVEVSRNIYVSIVKSGSGSEPSKIRLRSVSDKAEAVKFIWKSREPSSISINGITASGDIQVPANGFVTLELAY